jgi:hypothetical protein
VSQNVKRALFVLGSMMLITLFSDLVRFPDRGPLSLLLFSLVVYVFTRTLSKAINKGYISDFMDDVYLGGVISLKYTYDTLLFLSHNNNSATHLKWIMI